MEIVATDGAPKAIGPNCQAITHAGLVYRSGRDRSHPVLGLAPVAVIVAIRLGIPTSQLHLPLCFASHGSTMLTLIGAPLNMIASNTAEDAGYGLIGFFEFAVAGIPMLLGTAAIILLFGRRLLPERSGSFLPADFSAHAQTLVEHYRIEDGVHRLRVRSTSPYVGAPRSEVDLRDYPGVSLVGVQEGECARPLAAAHARRRRRAPCEWRCAGGGAARHRPAPRRPTGGRERRNRGDIV
jgi:di/tricarboxylate transporter